MGALGSAKGCTASACLAGWERCPLLRSEGLDVASGNGWLVSFKEEKRFMT